MRRRRKIGGRILRRPKRDYPAATVADFCTAALTKRFATAVRAHWHVENRLHWVLDVVFHDDLMRLRTSNGPANMATVRHMSLNLIRNIDDKASLKVRRKTIGWDDHYLFKAITGSLE